MSKYNKKSPPLKYAHFFSAAFAVGLSLFPLITVAKHETDDPLSRTLTEIETHLNARLGATIIDTESGKVWSHRADERFPMTSTFKAFACAGLLARIDAGKEDPNRRVVVHEDDLVTYSPVTEQRVGGDGMTLSELCEAAMSMSDNTAANIILGTLGGPDGFTRFMRSLGDDITRLDRWETALNEAMPDDPRDSTTPEAIARSLQELVLGTKLSPSSRQQLENWLVGNKVGGPLLRAGLPANWRIADRTGAGGYGSRSIVAVIWPPERKPAVVAIYITETEASMDERNAGIAEIGRMLATLLGPA
ncbi:class A beta-lactamase [Pseudomonas sp. Irchel s3a18]|uniref:class A beta-lactamase n=1 Tax=Pseudomonas sp. Irchel s3a18 TaxID=2009053 RepID=UPI000BA39F7F|nr:class A beta-lactamase [Pseudomonas sp. Irchel s3a18]